jgi:D-erythrulose 1-phosphate 3-epimerase
MELRLGVNTGFARNQFPQANDWVSVVADDLGLDTIQLTEDILSPNLPEPLAAREIERIRALCEKKGIQIQTTFTSAFARANHLLHPDRDIQRVWIDWFRRFFSLSAALGAEGSGSHFGLLSLRDAESAEKREQRIRAGVEAWSELAEHASEIGLDYLMFEPVPFRPGACESISETRELLARCADGFAEPMQLCLAFDETELNTAADGAGPYAWISEFSRVAPSIRIRRSYEGHTEQDGSLNAPKHDAAARLLRTMRDSGLETCTLLLDAARQDGLPASGSIIEELKTSVSYWREAIAAAAEKETP